MFWGGFKDTGFDFRLNLTKETNSQSEIGKVSKVNLKKEVD